MALSAYVAQAEAFLADAGITPLVALTVVVGFFVIYFLSVYGGAIGGRSMPIPHVEAPQLARKKPEKIADNELSCDDPCTGDHLGIVKMMDENEVKSSIKRARAAQADWKNTSFDQRNVVLRSLLDYILEHQKEIARIAAIDSGKTLLDAHFGEVLTVCEKLRWMMANGERYLRDEPRTPGLMAYKKTWVEYHPLGVIAGIIPWNYPFQNMFGTLIAPLYAGNAVLIKPSEWTTWSTMYYEKIMREVLQRCGHSPDLVQVIPGDGRTGKALITSGVDKVIFIGSPVNGKRVMESCVESLTPVTLELGGKDPFIVLEDADLNQVVSTALRGVFQNCGQNCIGVERIYVHESLYDQFVDRFVSVVKKMRQGAETEGKTMDCGAVVMPHQLNIIDELVRDAKERGAKVMSGGKRNSCLSGQFYEPTVLTDVTHEMRIAKEEVFGPVALIFKFENDEEAIRLANDSKYALASSVFGSAAHAKKVAKQIWALTCEKGTTTINDFGVGYLCMDLPFGGVKISGFGKFNGPEGIRDCCLAKSMVADRIPFMKTELPKPLQYPVSPKAVPFFNYTLRLVYGNGIATRLVALVGFLKTALSSSK